MSIQHNHHKYEYTTEYQKNKTSHKKEVYGYICSPKYKALSANDVQKVCLTVNSVDHMDIQQWFHKDLDMEN